MRVNCYSDELTERIEVVQKSTGAGNFVGIRFYFELPTTIKNAHGMKQIVRGPFEKVDGDDDSAAVTFWVRKGEEQKLYQLLRKASDLLETIAA